MTPVDHLEAALERVTEQDLAALPPALRRRLYAKLGSLQSILDELSKPRPKSGLLAELRDGGGRE
jgi:hypothetical protein